MPYYYVNRLARPQGAEHEVHDQASRSGCLPAEHNRIDLGYHVDCTSALAAARRHFDSVDGCYWCARPCHRG